MRIAVFAIAAMLIAMSAEGSDSYKVQVTRKGQDLYLIEGTGKNIYIKTAYCYEYATWEDAILVLDGSPSSGSVAIGKLVFTGSGSTTCQVDTVLQ